jgi:hypothetical protein
VKTEAFRAVEALAADQDFRVVPGHGQVPKLYQSGMPGRRRLASAAFATFPRCRPLVADLAAHRIGDLLVPGGYHDHPGDDFGQLDVRGADRGCVAGTPEVQD